jgi:hypothetical protein
MERAFKFLKSAALSGSAPGEGVAVGAGDATVALEGEGVSWADTVKIAKTETIRAQQRTVLVIMRG